MATASWASGAKTNLWTAASITEDAVRAKAIVLVVDAIVSNSLVSGQQIDSLSTRARDSLVVLDAIAIRSTLKQ